MLDSFNFPVAPNIIVFVATVVLVGIIIVTLTAIKSYYPQKFKNIWLNALTIVGEFALFCLMCVCCYQMLVPSVSYSSNSTEIPVLSVEPTAKSQFVIEEQLNGKTRKVIYPKTILTQILSDDDKYHFFREEPVRKKQYNLFGNLISTVKEDMDERLILAVPKNKELKETKE